MKAQTLFFTVLAALAALSAGFPHDLSALSARHAHLAYRAPPNDTQVSLARRCKPRQKASSPHTTVSATPAPSKAPPAPAKAPPTKLGNAPSSGGTIHIQTSSCGPSGATAKTTATTGPNGHIDWLNCGIKDGGWNPPFVRVEDVVTKNLKDALASPDSPFKACAPFVSLFEKYGNMNGLPPIVLAAFAMQESSCNPHAVGGAGEQGLMQITRDKCGGAPGGDCQNPDYNVRTGANFFSDLLNSNGGSLLLSIGKYNGWRHGLTFAEATSAAKTTCCRCQNNLDYLHQFLNGWLQNIDAESSNPRLGKYFNLDVCH